MLATTDELVEADEEELEVEEGVVVVIDEHNGISQSSHAPPGCL